jgi:SAM-dependent methyltransferase
MSGISKGEVAMQYQKKIWITAAVICLALLGTIEPTSSARAPDVHFIATPQYVVNEMLELAGTNQTDVVYDLGCGDGRFVITAAKNFGARGVGIDIDPERIREGRLNARKAGVNDRVTFHEQDLFATDISPATIVALYLLPELNLSLRPRLFKQLKPGTRIVSHDFDMGDWKPDVVEQLGESTYYYWVLPADVKGRWNISAPALGKDGEYTVEVVQNFQEIQATLLTKQDNASISQAKIKGDTVSFFLGKGLGRNKTGMFFKGRVTGNTISGNVQVEINPFYSHLEAKEETAITGNHGWTAVRSK